MHSPRQHDGDIASIPIFPNNRSPDNNNTSITDDTFKEKKVNGIVATQTILALDIVGSTNLMSQDQTGTIERVKSIRIKIIDKVTASYGGVIFNTAGDGFYVKFSSARNGLDAAVEIQERMRLHQDRIEDGKKIVFRAGLHVGDTFENKDDVFGIVVNIAQRIETIAEPGLVYFSKTIFDFVSKTDLSLLIENVGPRTLKGIEGTTEIFRAIPKWYRRNEVSKGMAILIGISKYNNYSNLEYVKNDIRSGNGTPGMADALLSHSTFITRSQDILTASDEVEQADIDRLIDNGVSEFKRQFNSGDKGTLLLYISGHGSSIQRNGGKFDLAIHTTHSELRNFDKSVLLWDLVQKIEGIRGDVVVVVDSCMSGNEAIDLEYIEDFDNVTLFCSCSEGEKSYPTDDGKQSKFTHRFIEMVTGKKQASLEDRRVTTHSIGKNLNKFPVEGQTPRILLSNNDVEISCPTYQYQYQIQISTLIDLTKYLVVILMSPN